MTYTIAITEPGAEPVTVSLEWTAEAPKVAGLYFVETPFEVSEVRIHPGFQTGDAPVIINSDGWARPVNKISNARWLGPIPMPPKGA